MTTGHSEASQKNVGPWPFGPHVSGQYNLPHTRSRKLVRGHRWLLRDRISSHRKLLSRDCPNYYLYVIYPYVRRLFGFSTGGSAVTACKVHAPFWLQRAYDRINSDLESMVSVLQQFMDGCQDPNHVAPSLIAANNMLLKQQN